MEPKIISLLKKHKKKAFLISALSKIPLLIYLMIFITTVPAIDAIKYDYILGAHRGDSVNYTENTLEAIASANQSEEYSFIEFDIQYTKDNKIVVFHDNSLLRMSGDPSNISELTYEELQNSTEFEIPTYDQVMEVIDKDKKINIEIKSSENTEKDLELLDFIIKDATEKEILDNIMISSVSREVINHSKTDYQDIKTGKVIWIEPNTILPFNFFTEQLYQDMQETQADYIMLHGHNLKNIDKLVELKPQDKTLVFWYFDNQMYLIQVDENDGMW